MLNFNDVGLLIETTLGSKTGSLPAANSFLVGFSVNTQF